MNLDGRLKGLKSLNGAKPSEDIDSTEKLVKEYEVTEIVVGLPKNMNGTIGPRGEICIAFAQELEQKLNVPVHLWDERLTTVAATRTLLEADVSRKKRSWSWIRWRQAHFAKLYGF